MAPARRFCFPSIKRSILSMGNRPLRRSIPYTVPFVVLSILAFLGGQFVNAFPMVPSTGRAFAAAAHTPDHHSTPPTAHQFMSNTIPFSHTISSGVTLSTNTLNTTAGPVLVNTLDVDLTDPHISLHAVQAHDTLVSSDETVSSMANRTGAIAGINGDYFEVNGPGRPIGMVIIDGQLLQSPNSYAVLGVTQSGTLTMGSESFSGSVTADHASYPLNSINVYNEASKGQLVMTTPELGTPPHIQGNHAVLLQPISTDTFIVRSEATTTSLSALAGQYALIGSGKAAAWLTSNLHRGDRLKIHTSVSPNNHLVQALGGGPILIKNGTLYHDPNSPNPQAATVRNPLTAISVNQHGTHARLVVFDGRSAGPAKSVGLTYTQAASYLLDQGAYSAMLFDTGGSTEMVARFPGQRKASVVNWPSEGHERPVANGLFVFHI